MIHVVCGPWSDLQFYIFIDSHHTHVRITRTVFIYLKHLHSISTLQLCNRHDGAGRLDAANERHRLLLHVGQKLVQIKIQNILLNVHYIFVNKWIPIIIAWKTQNARRMGIVTFEQSNADIWFVISGSAEKNSYSESFFFYNNHSIYSKMLTFFFKSTKYGNFKYMCKIT